MHPTRNFFVEQMITLVNKKILALNVRSILGYIRVAEPKYALSFLELALVFKIWSVENFHEQFLRTENKQQYEYNSQYDETIAALFH